MVSRELKRAVENNFNGMVKYVRLCVIELLSPAVLQQISWKSTWWFLRNSSDEQKGNNNNNIWETEESYSPPYCHCLSPILSSLPSLSDTDCLLYARSSGPMPTACLCWKWRTWWSWVINPTPNVSSPTYNLWSTTCADTRCPWVGPLTSDLYSATAQLRCGVQCGVVASYPPPHTHTHSLTSPDFSSPNSRLLRQDGSQ